MNIGCFILLYWAVTSNTEIVLGNILTISGIYLISWLIGYVTPGAPGGLGVKEAVMVFLLSGIMQESDIILSAFILRFCNIIGDFLAFLLNKIINKTNKIEYIGETK